MTEQADESSQNSQFDPNEKNVAEVQEHLDSADQEERERVLEAEREGKGRTTILNYEPKETGDSDDESDAEGNEGNLLHSETDVDTSQETKDEAKEEQENLSEKAAKSAEIPEGYDPFTDPLVPSSTLAENIAAELATDESGKGSSTLQALHDNKKSDDDKS